MMRRLALVLSIALVFAGQSFGAFIPINTSDAGDVAAFQAGATVITFETLTGQNTLTGGTPIAPTSQLDNQLKAGSGVFFTSGGNTPIAVLDVTNIGKARSGKNVVAPIDLLTEDDQLCDGCFMEVFFTSAQNKFGGWFDNADLTMFIFWTDSTQDQVSVSKGNFAGGTDTEKTIDHVLLLFTTGGGVGTMDDLTFGGTTTVIPEPATMALIGSALLALGYFRKKIR